MNKKPHSIRSASLLALLLVYFIAALAYSNPALAFAPDFVGRVIAWGFLYLLLLAVLPFMISYCENTGAWCLYLGLIFCPFIQIGISNLESTEASKEHKEAKKKDLEAFGVLCKDRKREVLSREILKTSASLELDISHGFPGVKQQVDAVQISSLMGDNSTLCQKTSLRHLEDASNKKWSESTRRFEKSIRRYSLCTNEGGEDSGQLLSRYKLLLGEETHDIQENHKTRMTKSSIRIVDTLTNKTLSKDSMFFFQYNTGIGGCPNGLDQIVKLIEDTFPSE